MDCLKCYHHLVKFQNSTEQADPIKKKLKKRKVKVKEKNYKKNLLNIHVASCSVHLYNISKGLLIGQILLEIILSSC